MHKVLMLLGLAKRAGKIIVGTDAVISKLRENKLKLIFVASDSSLSTIDKLEKKAFYYNVLVIKSFSSSELSHSLGILHSKVIAVTDEGFVKKMISYLDVKVESEQTNES